MQNQNLIIKYNYIKKLYKLNIDIKLNINFISNKIIMILNKSVILFKLPSYFFYKINKSSENVIFLSKFHYITFLKHLFNFYNNFFCFYYYILKLKGLGYRVFQITASLLKIFFNRSNFFYLHVPASILLKYRTRKFFFVGLHYQALKVMILHLLFLKEFVIYKVNGIFYTRQIILIKPGKNKFR